jgi:mannosyltransferase OCH1-like enzyme
MKAEGALVKSAGRLFHLLRPRARFEIPPVDPPRAPAAPAGDGEIPHTLWITNFTPRCTLPVWFNFRRNRRLSRSFECRFVDDTAMDAYFSAHAPERLLRAWNRLADGAARADLWRVFALWREGGVYADMDGSFTRPLEETVAGRRDVFLWDRRRYSNFFLAAAPGHPLLAKFLDAIVGRIEAVAEGEEPTVFYVTGPGTLETVLDGEPGVSYVPHHACCVQGVFTNERFQYADRPGSKWTHKRTFLKPSAPPAADRGR